MSPFPSLLPSTYSRITLRQRPKALIQPSLHDEAGTFKLEKGVRMPKKEDLKVDEVLVKVEWVSIDPAMRGWLNPTRSYVPPVAIGATMRAVGVGRVALVPSSSTASFAIGDWVTGLMGWTEYAQMQVKELESISVSKDVSPTYYLGALGMTGQTAYWGLLDVAKIKQGETVVVSGAAGAVGSLGCQIALLHGCRVIALAGGPEKCSWLKDLGCHEVIDYKQKDFQASYRDALGKKGVDVYFDNVGGEILDMVLTRLNKKARIALCGAISAYNDPNPRGIQNYLTLISQRAKIEGFLVTDYTDRFSIASEEMARWIRSGKLILRETRTRGLTECVNALIGVFEGKNTGKMLVKISDDGLKL
ncbi:hypothetical protein JCM1840_004089 [Sporobolomyces johnsonii]